MHIDTILKEFIFNSTPFYLFGKNLSEAYYEDYSSRIRSCRGAIDLAGEKRFQVTVADINPVSLEKLKTRAAVTTVVKDLSDPEKVQALVDDYDLVLSAVPGFLGFNTLKAIIEAGKNVVDIAFFPEDPFLLDGLAKKNNVRRRHEIKVSNLQQVFYS